MNASMTRARRREKGYSLIEILVSLGLMTGVMVAICSMFVLGGTFVKSGRQLTQATALAQDIMEDINKQSYTGLYLLLQGASPDPNAQSVTSDTRVSGSVANGNLKSIHVGPEVQRFGELKVGDKVTMRYTEAIVAEIKRAGEATTPGKEETKVVRGTGPRPGGTATNKMTTTVTVLAIDGKAPAVTVKTEDGRTVSFRVADASNLEGVKVGDRVQITYTEALAISVESPK